LVFAGIDTPVVSTGRPLDAIKDQGVVLFEIRSGGYLALLDHLPG
jgi:hypothetical protein